MTKFIFVRHGQSEANRDGIFAGHYNCGLTEKGHAQAEMTAEYIYNNYKIDAAYGSDLKRAFDTGKHITDMLRIELVPDKRLREIYAGRWDGNLFSESRAKYPEEFYVWDNDIGNCRPTDGESVREVGARIFGAIADISAKNEGKTVLIATHAIPIRALMCISQGGDYNDMKNIPWVSNSSVSVATFEDGKISFDIASYDAHLGEKSTKLRTE